MAHPAVIRTASGRAILLSGFKFRPDRGPRNCCRSGRDGLNGQWLDLIRHGEYLVDDFRERAGRARRRLPGLPCAQTSKPQGRR